MGLFRLLSKLTGVEQKVKWSRGKRLTVRSELFDIHYIYVDRDFHVVMFFPKPDGTLHVFLGNIVEGNWWLKYDGTGAKLIDEPWPPGSWEWKIDPGRVLFKGHALPPGQDIYEGRVVAAEPFSENIDTEWIERMKSEYLTQMGRGPEGGVVQDRKHDPAEPTDEQRRLIAVFEQELNSYRDLLWGFSLYFKTTPDWLRPRGDAFEASYHETVARCTAVIARAERCLADARRQPSLATALVEFPWVPWMDEMLWRCAQMLVGYERLWPQRDRTELSAREAKQLSDYVIDHTSRTHTESRLAFERFARFRFDPQ